MHVVYTLAIVNVFFMAMPIKQSYFPPRDENAFWYTYRGITLAFGIGLLVYVLIWLLSDQPPSFMLIYPLALALANLAAYGAIAVTQQLRDGRFTRYYE